MKCCFCHKETDERYSSNAAPVREGRCCSECNLTIVIPARVREILSREGKENENA